MGIIGLVVLLCWLILMLNRQKPLNKKVQIARLYPHLAPAERIRQLFDEKINPFLTERGFRYSKSKTEFKRRVGPFTHKIDISKSKWNRTGETCSFWIGFIVIANNYNEWHQMKYGMLPMNNIVTGFSHNHLKNWKTDYKLDKYHLEDQDNIKVFDEIKENLDKLILPILDKYADYEKAADELMEKQEFWWAAKIYDFYTIAGKTQKAKDALLAGKKFYEKQIEPQDPKFNALHLRLKEI